MEEFKMNEEKQTQQGFLGKCPACGGEIIEGKKGFGCRNWREPDGGCRFVVWKEIAGNKIDPMLLKTLLSGGATPAMTFRSKEGREFSASLKLERNEKEGRWETRFVSAAKEASEDGGEPQETSQLGNCPRCGAAVEEGPKGFGCRNWRQEDGACRFVIWKTIAGKQIPRKAVQDLLTKGKTQVINGFVSKKGKEFSASLRLGGDDYKTVFVFDDSSGG
ncbi:MAG: hypothetical protein C4530_16445 [Desulfobacteraceae bacterium]|nr:MAG: hypothetical protein C4530_16445 [Desulfobacteraceae bacterium]